MSTTTGTRPSSFNPTNPLIRSSPKKTMSITQTYYLAHKARAKLSREAGQSDHDLRLLVGHANLLDSLMLELADAEREQESWFNQSVRGATKTTKDRHIQWADRIVEEAVEEEYDDDTSDSESDSSDDDYYEDDDVEMANAISARTVAVAARQVEHGDDTMGDDLEEDYAHLQLARTPSHSSSPPELVDNDSDSSDDESMPPSPAEPVLAFSEKDAKAESAAQEEEESFYEEKYHVPRRTPTGLVSAISVY